MWFWLFEMRRILLKKRKLLLWRTNKCVQNIASLLKNFLFLIVC